MTTLNSELLIDSKILRENISYIKSKLENQTNFMSVIKSDAYGHNLEFIITVSYTHLTLPTIRSV